MIALTPSIYITPKTLKSAYEALRRLTPIPDHPLLKLMLVQQHRQVWDDTITSQQALFDVLIDLLTTEFNQLREVHRYAPVNPTMTVRDAQTDLMQLGMCLSERLLACGAVYYYYVYGGMSFGKAEIATLLHYDDRMLRRRIEDFWRYLCRVLLRAEQEAWHATRQLRCQLALPHRLLIQLVGQEQVARSLVRRLKQVEPACLMIYGPAGSGKTVLALRVAHHLIEQHVVNDVVWLDTRQVKEMPLTTEGLAAFLCHGLGIATNLTTDPVDSLSHYLYRRFAQGEQLLLVLDDVLDGAVAIHGLWHVLCHCVVLVTTRQPIAEWYGLKVACPLLTEQDAEAVLRFWDEDRRRQARRQEDWSNCDAEYARLVTLGNGNLGRLKRCYERWCSFQETPRYFSSR